MSSVFEEFVQRRRELREMLDHFGREVYETMNGLAQQIQMTDPMNKLLLLRAEFEQIDDGSINIALHTSNNRTLTMFLQSNGDVRVVSSLSLSPVLDEYVDLVLEDDGEVIIETQQEKTSIREYIYAWAVNAFEE